MNLKNLINDLSLLRVKNFLSDLQKLIFYIISTANTTKSTLHILKLIQRKNKIKFF